MCYAKDVLLNSVCSRFFANQSRHIKEITRRQNSYRYKDHRKRKTFMPRIPKCYNIHSQSELPRPIKIRPQMYVRRSIMYEIATLRSPEVHA